MTDLTVETHLTVGRLREVLADLPDNTQIMVHAGWDFPLLDEECEPEIEDGKVVLFLDYDDVASMVNKDWAAKHHNCPGPQSGRTR